MSKTGIVVVAALAVAILAAGPAGADGAIAVGMPSNVSKFGVSLGTRYNSKSMDDARAGAINNCKTAKDAGEVAKKLCTVVATFRDQCFAFSIDPKAGTPGFGWAIAQDEAGARTQALENCQNTAGPSRRGACVVTDSGCDKTGN